MNDVDFQKIRPLVQPIKIFKKEFIFSSFIMKYKYLFSLKESDFSKR